MSVPDILSGIHDHVHDSIDIEESNFDLSDASSEDDENFVDHHVFNDQMFVHHHPLLSDNHHIHIQHNLVNENKELPVFLGKRRRRTLRADGNRKKKVDQIQQVEPIVIVDQSMKGNRSKIFTPERDVALQEAVAQFGKHWEKVMEHLNFPGVKKEQYQKRYAGYASPEVENRDRSPWTNELDKLLIELVPQNLEKGRNKETINWTKVSKEMNRNYYDCQGRWNTLRKSCLLVGRFTPEEDEQILRFHREWTGSGKGIWVALEKLLNRRNDVIRKRWNLLSKRRKVSEGNSDHI